MWLRFYSCESRRRESSSVVKAESGWVVVEEVDKAVDDNVDGSGLGVVTGALRYDVFPSLYVSRPTWATSTGVGEEPLAVFANGSVSCGHPCESSAQGIGEAY